MNYKNQFYYITHIDNLFSILKNGILSHNEVLRRVISHTRIWDYDVVNKRKFRRIDKGPLEGFSLWDFANLYFNPRNPMLCRVINERGLDNVVIVAVSRDVLYIDDIYVADGNAASDYTNIYYKGDHYFFLDKVSEIGELAWFVPYRCEEGILDFELSAWEMDILKKMIMAELLVPERVPKSYINTIYVPFENMAWEVKDICYDAYRNDVHVKAYSWLFFH